MIVLKSIFGQGTYVVGWKKVVYTMKAVPNLTFI